MKQWFTAAELSDLALPAMPATESAVIRAAKAKGWQRPELEWSNENPRGIWRKRTGRGGGVEYHMALLPTEAQAKLALALAPAPPPPAPKAARAQLEVSESWRWYNSLPDKAKIKAQDRLHTLDAVETLLRNGTKKEHAIPLVAAARQVATSSIWGWYAKVQGRNRADWLPELADRYAGRVKEAEVTAEAWEAFKADYLRVEKPTAESCFERVGRIAAVQGWTLPTLKTLLRKIEREISVPVRVYCREGLDALKRLYPAQERDRSMFHAMEAVNGDGHKIDVFVKWPDGEIVRPMIVVFQDLYSGKYVSWRCDKSENRESIRLALGDLCEDYGIPNHIYFDNTRAFANKALTAGTQNRYRFKIKDEDPVGICTLLGIEVHFVLPYSGQSKPIERSFRDVADRVARHPAFAGAYVGNNPMAKPENYGSKAIPLDDFLKVFSAEVIHHNARLGRRSKVCGGEKSFDQVFAASYADAKIRIAEPEKRLLWLLAAEGVKASNTDGSITLLGNRYWCDALHAHLGQSLVARFDPQDLGADLHVYRLDGAYIGAAECVDAAGFADAGKARDHARARRHFLKATKMLAEAELSMETATMAAMIPTPADLPPPEAKVVSPVFGTPHLGAMGMRKTPEASPISAAEQAVIDSMEAEMTAPAQVVTLETVESRFTRLLEIERRMEAGEAVADEDRRWVQRQSRLPDIKAKRDMYEDFGEAALTA